MLKSEKKLLSKFDQSEGRNIYLPNIRVQFVWYVLIVFRINNF